MTHWPGELRLEGRQLACRRGRRLIFEDVSFALARGELMTVVGRNGAGKSSFLRLVAGLVPREAGTITLAGGAEDTPLAAQLHYSGHADAVKPALTVAENLEFWRAFLGPTGLGVDEALERFGIDHLHALPGGYLSAGQKRRLALARLIVTRRPLWLLDEPTSALDAATQAVLSSVIMDHLAEGGMAIAATHGDIGVTPARVMELRA